MCAAFGTLGLVVELACLGTAQERLPFIVSEVKRTLALGVTKSDTFRLDRNSDALLPPAAPAFGDSEVPIADLKTKLFRHNSPLKMGRYPVRINVLGWVRCHNGIVKNIYPSCRVAHFLLNCKNHS